MKTNPTYIKKNFFFALKFYKFNMITVKPVDSQNSCHHNLFANMENRLNGKKCRRELMQHAHKITAKYTNIFVHVCVRVCACASMYDYIHTYISTIRNKFC